LGTEFLREQISYDLERQFRVSYRVALLMISAYYAVLIPYYMTAYRSPVRLPVVLVTAGALVLLLACLAILERLHPKHFQFLGVAAMAILAGPILMQLALTGSSRHHLEMGLIVVASALIFHQTLFFLAAQMAVAGTWAAVLWHQVPARGRMDTGLGVLSTLIVALTAHLILRALLKNQVELRLKNLTREAEKDHLHAELAQAFESVRTLRGLVPICAHCNKIRDDSGFWQKVETYVESHSHAEFTHGLCPDCLGGLKDQFEALVPEANES